MKSVISKKRLTEEEEEEEERRTKQSLDSPQTIEANKKQRQLIGRPDRLAKKRPVFFGGKLLELMS